MLNQNGLYVCFICGFVLDLGKLKAPGAVFGGLGNLRLCYPVKKNQKNLPNAFALSCYRPKK